MHLVDNLVIANEESLAPSFPLRLYESLAMNLTIAGRRNFRTASQAFGEKV